MGGSMTRLLAAGLFVLLALDARAQEIQLTLSDGSIVQGELKGFENGKYRVLVGGTVREYDEADVVTLVLLERGTDQPPVNPVDGVRRQLQEGKDGTRAASEFVRAFKSLSQNDRRKLLDAAQQSLEGRLDQAFVVEFADAVAKDSGLDSTHRPAVGGTLEAVGRSAERGKKAGTAWRILRAAVRLDSARAESLKTVRVAQAEADLRLRFQGGDYAAAVEAADEVLSLASDHPDAMRIREDSLRRKLDKELAEKPDARFSLLEEYARTTRRTESRTWAESEMAKVRNTGGAKKSTPLENPLTRYYPVAVGRWWEYRVGDKTGDGEVHQKLKITEVTPDGEGHRVRYTLDHIYRNYTNSRAFQLFVSPNEIQSSSGSDGAKAFPLLKAPLETGRSWSRDDAVPRLSREILSMSDSITTAMGTFSNCLVVRFTSVMPKDQGDLQMVSRSYYAPDVGLVRLVFEDAEFQKFNLDLVKRGQD